MNHHQMKTEAFEVWAITRTSLGVRDFAAKYIRAVRRRARESIQECEVCGVLDHHCIEGLCPRCAGKCES